MPSRYYRDLSCSNCDYRERIVTGPLSFKPKEGVFKSEIQTRWCYSCQGVRYIFTGIGGEYDLSEIPTLKGLIAYNKEDLIKRQTDLKAQYESLKRNKIWGKQKMRIIEQKLGSIKTQILEASVVELTISSYNEKARTFYAIRNPKPRCIKCNSDNVSQVEYTKDLHLCGGNFITKNPHEALFGKPLHVFLTEYPVYYYDENGFSVRITEQFF